MIAVDTNLLVYALDRPSPFHARALAALRRLAEGAEPWAVPWPCVYEFLRVATHPQIFRPPLPAVVAVQALQRLLAAPTLHLLAETSRHAEVLSATMQQSGCTGNLVHDAHIWALCLEHGVTELWSGDRDFHRFRGLKLHNPFAD